MTKLINSEEVVINEVTIGDGSEFENRKIQCTINGKKHMVHATRFISSYFKASLYSYRITTKNLSCFPFKAHSLSQQKVDNGKEKVKFEKPRLFNEERTSVILQRYQLYGL